MHLLERLAFSLLGVVFVGIAVALVFASKANTGESPTVSVALVVGGLLFLFVGINGERISELRVWNLFGIRTTLDKGKIQEQIEKNELSAPIPIPDSDVPADERIAFVNDQASDTMQTENSKDQASETIRTKHGEEYAIFELKQIPLIVLQRLIGNWPEGEKQDFSEFQYAARKTGPGNFAWYLQFDERAYWLGVGGGGVKVTLANGGSAAG